MKIALICPSSGPWNGIGKNKVFNGRSFRFSMLSLLTVARLSPADSQIAMVDEQIDAIDFDGDYDVVGLTAMEAWPQLLDDLAAGRMQPLYRGNPAVQSAISTSGKLVPAYA